MGESPRLSQHRTTDVGRAHFQDSPTPWCDVGRISQRVTTPPRGLWAPGNAASTQCSQWQAHSSTQQHPTIHLTVYVVVQHKGHCDQASTHTSTTNDVCLQQHLKRNNGNTSTKLKHPYVLLAPAESHRENLVKLNHLNVYTHIPKTGQNAQCGKQHSLSVN